MRTFLEFIKKNDLHKQKIDQFGDIVVYRVNGIAVRNSSKAAQEFGGSSCHYDMPGVVPKNEIWVEDDVKPKEQKVLIAATLYQIRKIESGTARDKAYDDNLKKQKDYRDSILCSKDEPWKTDRTAHKSVYIRKFGHIEDEDITVWLVDGEKVRDRYKTDFIEGGHGYVYKWVPNQEIWIEDGPHTKKELPFILLHEYLERALMKYKKIEYDKAHEIAARVEWRERGKGFSIKDALSLTTKQVLSMANGRSPNK